MPNKTIYVSKDDLALFDDAKKKAGGNLSPVIVKALNEYLGRSDSKADALGKGFNEVAVTLGSPGYEREKRFMGKRLFSDFDGHDKQNYRGFTLYETPKGQYVVVSCSLPDPWALETGFSDELHQALEMDDNPKLASSAMETLMRYGDGDFTDLATSYSLTICPTLDDVSKVLPGHVYEAFSDRLEQLKNPVQYLDI